MSAIAAEPYCSALADNHCDARPDWYNPNIYITPLECTCCVHMDRRKFILTAGTGAAVAVAGCNAGPLGGGGGGADTSSPVAVVESFYQSADGIGSDASTDEVLDEIDPFLHSASPLPDLLQEGEESGGSDPGERSLSSVSAEVGEEDVGEDALANDYGLGLFGVSESDIADIAEENAIVQATVEYEDADTQEPEHVTATENGDWLIVL